MVQVSIENSTAVFRVQGLHKLWAFRSRLTFPLAHIVDVRAVGPEGLNGWSKGLRIPGTHLPGVITAGTYYKGRGEWVFWDVCDDRRAIIVELTGEFYRQLIVEVANPAAEVARFQAAPLT